MNRIISYELQTVANYNSRKQMRSVSSIPFDHSNTDIIHMYMYLDFNQHPETPTLKLANLSAYK